MSLPLADLDPRTTLVTVNKRLAAELRARYDRHQADTGRQVWPTPDILPWNAWLQRLYTTLLDSGAIDRDLLSAYPERLLWEEAIERHAGADGLLRPSAAAELARQADALCLDWGLDAGRLAERGGDDTRSFLAWRATVERSLERQRLLSSARLPDLLIEAFAGGRLPPPAALVHAGFDILSPRQQALFGALEDLGCPVAALREPARGGQRRRVKAADTESEIRLAAHWARERLQAQPQARIGIVSPRLGQQRADLERIFTEILAPAAFLSPRATTLPFNISLGEALAERPMVAHALLALRLLAGPLTLAEAGQLLRSPFIGGQRAEGPRRALMDQRLRADGQPKVDLGRLCHRLQQHGDDGLRACPDLLERLQALRGLRQQLPASASPAAWAAQLQEALHLLGWPGDDGLDSHEFQQHERLLRVFSEFAALGKVRPRMRPGEALGQLASLAGEAVFQPQAGPVQVQILGSLEAAGMDFDALWLLDMHDQSWPPAPQPHPLIPTGLQRELGLPHASAERELAFASRLTERLANAAELVIASHACMDGDREQRASPLTAGWPPVDAGSLLREPPSSLRDACRAPGEPGEMPLPHAAGGPREAGGGAALLAAQAACPFSAVARHRLAARPLPEASFAPDAALQGNMVHAALQRVWATLRDSTTLAATGDDGLAPLVAREVDAVLADLGRHRPDLFGERFRAIEADRLVRLLLDWLACERARSQPFAVAALEQDSSVEVGQLTLHTRADRVDRLADGTLAIIDYKTGRQVGRQGWFDERLSEPQLPLYCLQAPGEVSATLLARVRRDGPGCGFVGLSREDGFAPGVSPPESEYPDTDWTRLVQHWRAAIADLADEIGRGRADPTPSPQACGYCELGALCRVRDMLAEAGDE